MSAIQASASSPTRLRRMFNHRKGRERLARCVVGVAERPEETAKVSESSGRGCVVIVVVVVVVEGIVTASMLTTKIYSVSIAITNR